MDITQQHLDTFHLDGFLPWTKILDDAQLAVLRLAYDAAFAESNATELAGSGKRMRQILNLGERSLPFHRLRQYEPILQVFSALIGPNLQLWHDQALWKPARDGGAVYWHQDNSYWHLKPATAVSCWLTLDDADADNGTMQLIPGSHLRPVHHGAANDTTALVDASAHVDASQAVTVALPAGACLFHHCQTLHYTAPNLSERQRRAFIIHAMTPGTSGPGGTIIPIDYSHPILSLRMG